jgi:hypothetical protein
MKTYTYVSGIDNDVIEKYNLRNIDERQFDFYLMAYLNSPDGWNQEGYFFEPSHNGNVLIRLSSQKTIREKCGFTEKLSCAELGGNHVFLNAERWFHGATESKLSLDDYRQYMVSHEIGHILGKGHVKCPCKGCKAPIMLQQTRGIGECIPNTNVKK